MCMIGYSDITPNSATTKLFSIMFVMTGFGFIDILLSGMVSYVLDLQENYLLRAAKTGRCDSKDKMGRMRIRMKVGLALGVVVICIGVGVTVMHYVEELEWLDSFYLSVMSVTTVGYEARVDKRHRRMAKWVLGQDLTVAILTWYSFVIFNHMVVRQRVLDFLPFPLPVNGNDLCLDDAIFMELALKNPLIHTLRSHILSGSISNLFSHKSSCACLAALPSSRLVKLSYQWLLLH
ncbi:hypothetical protein ACFE04_010761 [Oxalis oulophora]